MAENILEVRDVAKSFGGLRAVDGCTLAVRPRTITGLIGPNGAGKSTLFNVIAGLYAPDAGEVVFDGHRLDGAPAHQIARRGLLQPFPRPACDGGADPRPRVRSVRPPSGRGCDWEGGARSGDGRPSLAPRRVREEPIGWQ